ncbi:C-C chemokine receptor type 4 isoform X2 [Crotalus tigris]|nr:C-C chemokine receptor type 4 isoform X2 [Crotalus tigris]XP_039192904.1 C-C chemokine receptor type 4 isoform X2 [Crotalus tigris]
MMSITEAASISMESSSFIDYEYDYDGPQPCIKDGVRNFGSLFLPTLCSLVFLLGLTGNTLVVLVLLKYKRLKSMTDIYVLNLAISDLLFVLTLPFWSYFMADKWVFGDTLCKIVSWTFQIGFFSGIFFIMLMSIDRYLAIVHIAFSLKARTATYGSLTSLIVWLVAINVSVPDLIFSSSVNGYNRTECKLVYHKNSTAWKLFACMEINILGLIVPSIIISFCYARIVLTLLHCRNNKKKKAVKMIFVVVVVFFMCWTPNNVILFLKCLDDVGILGQCEISKNLDYADQVTQILTYFHCCLNPIIYFFMGQKFKLYIRLFFKNCVLSKILCKSCGFHESFYSESSGSGYTQSTSDEETF